LKSEDGKKSLLVDGWYKYARKIHYTCDVFMAAQWGMLCGFGNVLPYYYVFFFSGMIFHRLKRDEEKCR
jgi:delta24(24(1))-sterol reductase